MKVQIKFYIYFLLIIFISLSVLATHTPETNIASKENDEQKTKKINSISIIGSSIDAINENVISYSGFGVSPIEKLEKEKRNLADIKEIKNDEDSELEMWGSVLNEIQEKLDSIDKTLFEPESDW